MVIEYLSASACIVMLRLYCKSSRMMLSALADSAMYICSVGYARLCVNVTALHEEKSRVNSSILVQHSVRFLLPLPPPRKAIRCNGNYLLSCYVRFRVVMLLCWFFAPSSFCVGFCFNRYLFP